MIPSHRNNPLRAYLAELLRLPEDARRSALRPALLVTATALGLTLASAWITRLDIRKEGERRFDAMADRLVFSVTESMDAYEQVLRGGVGVFDAFGDVSAKAWATYVEGLRLQRNYPGIQGVGYAIVYDPRNREALLRKFEAESIPAPNLTPPGERDLHTAIIYLEPLDWRNSRAIGYDMYSEEVRRAAMVRARDTGEASMSGGVTLLQETSRDVQVGVLLYLPVYLQGSSSETTEQRRSNIRGFVYSPFRLDDFMNRVFQRTRSWHASEADVTLIEKPTGKVLFDGGADAGSTAGQRPRAADFQVEKPLVLHGAQWQLRMSSTPVFESTLNHTRPYQVVGLGSLLSALLGIIVGLTSLGREKARLAAKRLSDEIVVRQQAEDQARVALRELAHRVKNMLSIVSAIASQTARNSTDLKAFDRAFRDRLAGLGRVHDLLASTRTYGTDLKALAREVLRPYQDERGDGLDLDGPVAVLSPNSAIMLSMLINELATNATKYGSWSVPGGRVSLSWSIEPTPAGDQLEIHWKEQGGPQVEPPRRSGFGSNVIRFAIERSLRGVAEANFAPEGVAYRITIPWDVAQHDQDEPQSAG